MQLISVRELFKNTDSYIGKEISVGGWVRSIRGSKQFGFIVLNDGTYFNPVQVVYHDTMENFQEINKTNVGCFASGVATKVPLTISAAPTLVLLISWKFSMVSW